MGPRVTLRCYILRYMESLRALGEVLMDSVDSFLAVSFLCALFLVVFTILGLHVFGDLVLDIESPNFHGFYQAFLTTFQVRFDPCAVIHRSISIEFEYCGKISCRECPIWLSVCPEQDASST